MTTLTTPDNLVRWTTSDPASLVAQNNQLADSVQAALVSRAARSYAWTNKAGRDAQTGMLAGHTGFQSDITMYWFYDGTRWLPLTITPFASTATATSQITSLVAGTRIRVTGTLVDYQYDGTAWRPFGTARVRLLPTLNSTGGTVAVSATTGEITGTGAVTMIRATLANVADYRFIAARLEYTGGTAGGHTIKVCLGNSPDATATSYRGQGGFEANTTRAVQAMTAGSTGWWHGYPGSRITRTRDMTFARLGDAAFTRYTDIGADNDASTNELTMQAGGQHLVATAFDGIQFDFSTLGTFTDISLSFEGVL